jgi:OOP family OmpA-OmpF porin
MRHVLLRWWALALAGLALAWPLAAPAQQLSLPPNAEMAREVRDASGSHALPVGPWTDGRVETLAASGDVTRQAWRIGGASATTLQLMDQLAGQISAAGFETLFRCEDATCGGFDFRFAIQVLPPPEMFVDLFDYRFLSARRGTGAGARYVSILLSRSGAATYVQVTRVVPAVDVPGAPEVLVVPAPQVPGDDAAIMALRAQGHVVLSGLDFATGSAALGDGPFASLAGLAAFLKGDAARRVALVGHTDTVGGYDANLALSRSRARAVMQRLIDAHGVPAAQLEAEGIAYLAPHAPNTDAAGREANRRVEAVLLSGQ